MEISHRVFLVSRSFSRQESRKVLPMTAWTTPLDRLLRAASPAMALPAGTEAVLYSLDSQDMVLLWGEDPFPDGGMMELPRLAPAFYVLLAAGLLVVLTPLAVVLRHKKAGRPLDTHRKHY